MVRRVAIFLGMTCEEEPESIVDLGREPARPSDKNATAHWFTPPLPPGTLPDPLV